LPRRVAVPLAAVLLMLILAVPARAATIWTPVASGTTDEISAIEYQADDRFWFTTTAGKIYQRVGGSFVERLNEPAVIFTDIEFQAGGSIGLAVGKGGFIYRTIDGGASWTQVGPTGIPSSDEQCDADAPLGDVNKVAFARAGVAYAFGARNQVIRSQPADASQVGAAGTWVDANRDAASTPDKCWMNAAAPITGAFFIPTGSSIAGYFMSQSFGEVFFTANNLAGTPQSKANGPNGFTTAHKLAGDPANPNRQWAVAVAEGGNPSYFSRTEDGWGGEQNWEEGNPSKRDRNSAYDIAYNGGTVLTAGAAGQIMNSIDGRTFFYVDAEGAGRQLQTQEWRAVALASGTKGAVGGTAGKLVLTDRANTIPDVVPPTGLINGPDRGEAGKPLTFTAQVSDNAGGSGVDTGGFAWTSAGLPPASGATATFTFPSPGTYSIRLGFRDLEGNTADATKSVTITTPTAVRPSLPSSGSGVPTARRIRGRVRITVRGRLRLPAGADAATVCRGQVVITVKKGRRLLTARTARLSRTCGYRKTITLARSRVGNSRTLKVTVRFGGNASLGTAQRTYTVRIRR
jgi:photosystem II stability/assembly factor-like uncharacterized protein